MGVRVVEVVLGGSQSSHDSVKDANCEINQPGKARVSNFF